MKKIRTIILFFVLTNVIYAQKDFFELINSFDWNKTENEIVELFGSDIEERKHYYSDYDKTITNYQIIGVTLGNLNFKASIFVDSISSKVHSLSFNFGDITKQKDAKNLSIEMDNHLLPILGTPDKREDNQKATYMGRLNRTWYKENYILEVSHMIFSDSHVYSLTVRGLDNIGGDFRVAKWGESKFSVIEKEGKIDKSTSDRLYLFSDNVAGLPCDVAYVFTNNKLTMAKYLFKSSHTNKNDYIKDYREVVELMEKKYGEPDYNSQSWHNSLYKNDPDDYGFAISLGHLSYSTGWLGEITDITIALHGENSKIELMIQYVSKKYEEMQQEKRNEEKIKDL